MVESFHHWRFHHSSRRGWTRCSKIFPRLRFPWKIGPDDLPRSLLFWADIGTGLQVCQCLQIKYTGEKRNFAGNKNPAPRAFRWRERSPGIEKCVCLFPLEISSCSPVMCWKWQCPGAGGMEFKHISKCFHVRCNRAGFVQLCLNVPCPSEPYGNAQGERCFLVFVISAAKISSQLWYRLSPDKGNVTGKCEALSEKKKT